MNENRQDIVGELKNIESKIDSGSIESAREELRALRKRLDVTESTGVTGSQDGRTVGVEIDIWSYEYKDSIYFVTSDYASISEAVSELVSDYIPKLANPGVGKNKTAEAAAASIRDSSDNIVSRSSYEDIDLDEEVSVHTDVYYMRASVHYNGEVVQNINNPKSDEIVDATNTVVERAGEDEEE
ncbi:hypothetical protein [Haloarcula sp. R1-2]|nr:hypothetical protein [Haloarcula sp. R1-2]